MSSEIPRILALQGHYDRGGPGSIAAASRRVISRPGDVADAPCAALSDDDADALWPGSKATTCAITAVRYRRCINARIRYILAEACHSVAKATGHSQY